MLKKKLFTIFGPLVAAVILVSALFILPIQTNHVRPEVWKKASTAMSGNILGGNMIKNQAIASGEYVPFFGSSELSRFSPFHPSVLATKYHRNYRPFLLGAPGTQSLNQFAVAQSLRNEITNGKAIFVISPQWFVEKGVSDLEFNAYFSELQLYDWLLSLHKTDQATQFYAQRLLHFSRINQNKKMSTILTAIANGKTIDELPMAQLATLKSNYQLLQREDQLFSQIGMFTKNKKVNKFEKQLPEIYNYQQLDALAYKIGEHRTKNNQFLIDNQFYQTRLQFGLKDLKNSQTTWSYCQSPEFADFQLVLNQFAKSHTDVLFIIPPVNKRWSDYTGLSQEMLQNFAAKIKYQLTSQGFNQVVDFSKEDTVPYFMADTIHLGWRGWLKADAYIAPFLVNPQPKVNYQLNNERFFSKQWQEQVSEVYH
ncbi:D-alanyl-lipoteichoic acid biosynthesis protein DltD [Enterococcus columbae]|uniref:Protein DltD n=1 Tax=Enterococcus columbae DSM 7374 = ATCC 51263 TaxID=1121865 RepID=S1NST7_9ENTE|nr:D-alanyl-lipoteichoic acid biosynthesis protein DltD [Enterococcus columbae]EOT39944.1 D-alanyl-lipoteichoic acid biosynthesis protein DltD [Enterococcus columbae DSM 7374 = ATCC 51263]EOW83929.1 D-alanyl-lipoteichoic acid biosynthesis protein DltD [Enterococcus columbae DSM 7374 = ATCC 51263]OJG25851.1 D-alanyl-lipoteichoic acid biosynthesis protein DltD [Enterococcus columbae DSM 7374 = ATCC 51263]